MQPVKKFTVGLLINEIKDTQEVSAEFRKLGIYAHYYKSIEELWMELDHQNIDLLIADVTKMSQGKTQLTSHKNIREGKCRVVYFHKAITAFLLNSAFKAQAFGTIYGDVNIAPQIQLLLKKINDEARLEGEKALLERKVHKLKIATEKVATGMNDKHREIEVMKYSDRVTNAFGRLKTGESFFTRLSSFLDRWEACQEYSIYRLDSSGQKLTPCRKESAKNKLLPELWLSHTHKNGMTQESMDMAIEVGHGFIEGEIRSIPIFGNHDGAEVLLMGMFQEDKLVGFNWKALENQMISEYRAFRLSEVLHIESETQRMSNTDLLELLDNVQYNRVDFHQRVVVLKFEKLMAAAIANVNNRFYWKEFWADLTTALRSKLGERFELSILGASDAVLLMDKKTAVEDSKILKDILTQIQYWKYFEDDSLVIKGELAPSVEIIAPSASNLISRIKPQVRIEGKGKNIRGKTRPTVN